MPGKKKGRQAGQSAAASSANNTDTESKPYKDVPKLKIVEHKPESKVKTNEKEKEKATLQSSNQNVKASSPSASSMPDFTMALYQAKHGVRNDDPGMLSLEEKDMVQLIRKEKNGFWLVKKDGKTGWILGNCLEEIEDAFSQLFKGSLAELMGAIKVDSSGLDSSNSTGEVTISFGTSEESAKDSSAFTLSYKDKDGKNGGKSGSSSATISSDSLMSGMGMLASFLSSSKTPDATTSSVVPPSESTSSNTPILVLKKIYAQLLCLEIIFTKKDNHSSWTKLNQIKKDLGEERKRLQRLEKLGKLGGKKKESAEEGDKPILRRLEIIMDKLDCLMKDRSGAGSGVSTEGWSLIQEGIGMMSLLPTPSSFSKDKDSRDLRSCLARVFGIAGTVKEPISKYIEILDGILSSSNRPLDLFSSQQKDGSSQIPDFNKILDSIKISQSSTSQSATPQPTAGKESKPAAPNRDDDESLRKAKVPQTTSSSKNEKTKQVSPQPVTSDKGVFQRDAVSPAPAPSLSPPASTAFKNTKQPNNSASSFSNNGSVKSKIAQIERASKIAEIERAVVRNQASSSVAPPIDQSISPLVTHKEARSEEIDFDKSKLGGLDDQKRLLQPSTRSSGQPQVTVYPLGSNQFASLSLVAWMDFTARSEGQGTFKRGQCAILIPFELNGITTYDPFSPAATPQSGWIRVAFGDDSKETTVPLKMMDTEGSWQSESVLVPAQFFLSEVRTKCYIRTAIQNSLSTAPANSKAKAQIQALNMLSSRIRDYTASHSCSVVTSSWIAAKAIPSVGKRRPALASAPASQKALPAPPISSKTDETQVPTPEKPEVASAAMDAPSNPTPPTVPETVITPASPASTASPKAKPFKKHGHFQKSPRLSARKDKRLKEKKEKKVQLQEKAKSEGSLKRISTTELRSKILRRGEGSATKELLASVASEEEVASHAQVSSDPIATSGSKEESTNPTESGDANDGPEDASIEGLELPSRPHTPTPQLAADYRQWAQSPSESAPSPSDGLKASLPLAGENEAQQFESENEGDGARFSPRTKEQRREKMKALSKAGLFVPEDLLEEFAEEENISSLLIRRNGNGNANDAGSQTMSRSTSGCTQETSLDSWEKEEEHSENSFSSPEVSLSLDSSSEVEFKRLSSDLNVDAALALMLVKSTRIKGSDNWAKEVQKEVGFSSSWPAMGQLDGWERLQKLPPSEWKNLWSLELQQLQVWEAAFKKPDGDANLLEAKTQLLVKLRTHNEALKEIGSTFKDLRPFQSTAVMVYYSALHLAEIMVRIGAEILETAIDRENSRDKWRAILRLQFSLRILYVLGDMMKSKEKPFRSLSFCSRSSLIENEQVARSSAPSPESGFDDINLKIGLADEDGRGVVLPDSEDESNDEDNQKDQRFADGSLSETPQLPDVQGRLSAQPLSTAVSNDVSSQHPDQTNPILVPPQLNNSQASSNPRPSTPQSTEEKAMFDELIAKSDEWKKEIEVIATRLKGSQSAEQRKKDGNRMFDLQVQLLQLHKSYESVLNRLRKGHSSQGQGQVVEGEGQQEKSGTPDGTDEQNSSTKASPDQKMQASLNTPVKKVKETNPLVKKPVNLQIHARPRAKGLRKSNSGKCKVLL